MQPGHLFSRVIFAPPLALTLRLGLGALFVWAGAVKLAAPRLFAAAISRYELVPEPLLVPVAIGLPLLEVAAGLGLICRIRGSLAAVIALLLLFLAVLWFGILHNLDIDCGCFSLAEQAEHASLKTTFGRDCLLLAAALHLWWHGRRSGPAHPNQGGQE